MPRRSCSCTASRSTGGSGARSSCRSPSATAWSRPTCAALVGRTRRPTGTPWTRFSPTCSRCSTSLRFGGSGWSPTTSVRSLGSGSASTTPNVSPAFLCLGPHPYLRFKPCSTWSRLPRVPGCFCVADVPRSASGGTWSGFPAESLRNPARSSLPRSAKPPDPRVNPGVSANDGDQTS
jgi:hypothetical protein